MTKKCNPNSQKSTGKLYNSFALSRIRAGKSLPEVKKLDDKAFDGHQKISINELRAIADQGGLYGIFRNNQLVAEAQLLLEYTDFYNLEFEKSAYCYGIAVDKAFRGNGLAKWLIHNMEELAKKCGKETIYLASRPENYASLKLWYNSEYAVCAYKDRYFGPDSKTDSRLLLCKSLTNTSTRLEKHVDRLMLKDKTFDPDLRSALIELLSKYETIKIEIDSINSPVIYKVYGD